MKCDGDHPFPPCESPECWHRDPPPMMMCDGDHEFPPCADSECWQLHHTVGSSDVASIIGRDPWRNDYTTWCRLTGMVPRYTDTDTAAQGRGRWIEKPIAERYAKEQGLMLQAGPPITEDPIKRDDWMHCRHDFAALPRDELLTWDDWENHPPDRLIEVKSLHFFEEEKGWGPPEAVSCPVDKVAQCAWQAAVLRVLRVDLVAYAMFPDELRVYHLEFTEAVLHRLVAQVKRWYDRHVIDGNPPPARADQMHLTHPYGGKKVYVEATDEDLAYLYRYALIREDQDRLKAEADNLKAHLMDRIGDAYGMSIGGKPAITWFPRKGRTTVDGKRLKADHPEIYEEYSKTGDAGRTFKPNPGALAALLLEDKTDE